MRKLLLRLLTKMVFAVKTRIITERIWHTIIFLIGVIMAPLERDFQSKLIKEIKTRMPEAIVMKNDASYIQGIPDLLILHGNRWAALECKKSKGAKCQPNQKYYVDLMNEMSYAAFIFPENESEVLNALQRSLES